MTPVVFHWHNLAACRGVDPSLMFPDRGDKTKETVEQLCHHCAVVDECFAAGINETFGIWGGMSERRRRLVRRRANGNVTDRFGRVLTPRTMADRNERGR
jgi:WhiB family redox-sensing transcriptional regulator